MRERPILFKPEQVRGILAAAGLLDAPPKLQTRRLLNRKWRIEPSADGIVDCFDTTRCHTDGRQKWAGAFTPGGEFSVTSPYGRAGDKLWVREKIVRVGEPVGEERWCGSVYEADWSPTVADAWPWQRSFLPPIHCPRGLSRIMLTLAEVRVERLQDITEADAIAEGIEAHDDDGVTYYGPLGRGHADPRIAFSWLWDEVNAKRATWESSPWVWVLRWKPSGIEVRR